MLRFLITTAALLLIVGVFWLFEEDLPAQEVDGRYSNEASGFLTTASGARVHFRDQGQPGGVPLVLVHGANASLHTWEPWVRELGDTYRVVTMDLPGHGLTGQVPDGDYSRSAQMETVQAVLDHLAVERFVLGGNSMGGGVAWRYALEQPGQVAALILVDASPPRNWREPSSEEPAGRTPIAFRLLEQPWFRAVARYVDPAVLVEQGLRAAYNDADVVDDELIARYRDLALREGSREAILSGFGQPRAETGSAADPASITAPTLILWGARDTLIDVRYAERFHAAIADSRLVVYPELGHVPMEEAPQRTAADVREFLQAEVAADL
ncbi:MAG: alpha/beta hydrolase [Gammaproteobacteria bacterium]|nr:alpha/beta hydrolase [Gammaproteobacteria bacterium]